MLSPRDDAEVPAELEAALAGDEAAAAAFRGLPPSHRREYIRWVGEATTADTRRRRAERAVLMLREGKPSPSG
jgi:uncharacterized protein YdeI (YjbR/CyaY-like superfamily)